MLFYSVFTISTEKNDHTVILFSLNPEGPIGSHLCDVTFPALLIMCQFLFCGRESKQGFFLWVKEIYVYPPAIFNGVGGHLVSQLYMSVRTSVPYVTQMVSVRYLLKRLVYWIEILYTGI